MSKVRHLSKKSMDTKGFGDRVEMIKDFIAVASAEIISRGFFFVFGVVVARTLPANEFGVYALAVSLGIWLWIVIDAGMTGHGIRLVAQGGEAGDLLGRITATRLVLTLMVTILLGFGLSFADIVSSEKAVYFGTALYLLAMSIFPVWIARAHNDKYGYVAGYLAVALMGVLSLGLFIFELMPHDGVGAILGRNLAWLIGAIIAFRILLRRDETLKPRFRLDFAMAWSTAPLGGAAILYGLIPLVPFAAIRFSGNVEMLGQYGAMWQLHQILLNGVGLISVFLLPRFARRAFVNNIFSHRRVTQIAVSSILITVIYYYSISKLLEIAYNDQFRFDDNYFIPFSIGLGIFFARNIFVTFLMAKGQYIALFIVGVAVITILIFLLFFSIIPLSQIPWLYTIAEICLLSLIASHVLFLRIKESSGAQK